MPASSSAFRIALLVAAVIAVSLAALLLRALAPASLERAVRRLESKPFWLGAAFTVLTGFLALQLLNTFYPGYLDHAEANIASVSWLVRNGAPLYHPFDSAARYSLLYGPTAYLPFVAALWLGGGATLSLKCVVLLANVLMIYFLWRTYRALFDAWRALFMVSVVLLFMHFPLPNHYLLQVRADVLILSALSVALFGATRSSGLAGPVALALGTAFIVDAKASAFIYVLPLFAIFLTRRGFRLSVVVGLATLAAAGLPFLAPNVSLIQYLSWLRSATGHPSASHDLISTLRTLPVLAAPLILIVGPRPWRDPGIVAWFRNNRLVLLVLLPCIAVAVLASRRIGAGSHHILPFIPVVAFLYAELYLASSRDFAKAKPWLVRYLYACLALVVVVRGVSGMREVAAPCFFWRDVLAAKDELRSVLSRYPTRRIAMGYGEAVERVTYLRPELVFASNGLLVDEVALSDMSMDGISIPAATVAAMNDCATGVWLIPKDQQPFALPSSFADLYPELVGRKPLFSDAFRSAFSQHYAKKKPTLHFDVWACEDISASK